MSQLGCAGLYSIQNLPNAETLWVECMCVSVCVLVCVLVRVLVCVLVCEGGLAARQHSANSELT